MRFVGRLYALPGLAPEQATGDQVVNAKTVLPWALTAVGAPSAVLALLVPVRESGSMLPQAAMSPVLQRSAYRRRRTERRTRRS